MQESKQDQAYKLFSGPPSGFPTPCQKCPYQTQESNVGLSATNTHPCSEVPENTVTFSHHVLTPSVWNLGIFLAMRNDQKPYVLTGPKSQEEGSDEVGDTN